jgi:hypothetical protein
VCNSSAALCFLRVVALIFLTQQLKSDMRVVFPFKKKKKQRPGSPLKGGKNKWPPAKTKQKQNNNNEFGESRRLYTFRNAIMHITINATVKVLAGVRSPNPLIHNPSRGNEKWDEDRNISE